jgi:hypothetical protein
MLLVGRSLLLATYILTFVDGREPVEVVADIFREEPPFIEFVALPTGGTPQLVASSGTTRS